MNIKFKTLFFVAVGFALFVTPSTEAASKNKNVNRQVSNQELQGLYNNGEYAPHIDFVNSAKESLDIEIYEMFDPDFQQAVKTALTERNVKVRIVKEPRPVSDPCNTFDFPQKKKKKEHQKPESCHRQKELMDLIISKGGVFIPFKKKELCGREVPPMNDQCMQHGKLIIVDQKAALISSGNFNSSSLCTEKTQKCNRDYSFITTNSDEVKSLQMIFDKDAEAKRYDPTVGLNKNITVSPYSHEPLIKLIESAENHLQIQNQYLKDPKLNAAIRATAKKGNVKVEVQLASFLAFSPTIKPGTKKNLCCVMTEFEKAGVNVKVFTPEQQIKGKNGYMHAKAIVADGKSAWMGSVNGSIPALIYNREFGILFDDQKEVQKLQKIMSEDFNHPKALDWKKQLDCTDVDLTNQCNQANKNDNDLEDN